MDRSSVILNLYLLFELKKNFFFRPLVTVTINNCGELAPGEDFGINCKDGTPDIYPHHPEDMDIDWFVKYFHFILYFY